ncbi:transmembrane amino acid transporter protein-domain-containing protein [Scheffersomyces xylosifermentans]|uniref:transmembrane amino acid transporter protein-domain-containing protein n=1 Tax=Scheffersomyces xylosifermentans TaxID=1304137 RepID=UPI00315D780F
MSYPPELPTGPSNGHSARRKSILDIGGPNSINNFASSYSRAQSYVGSTLLEQTESEMRLNDEMSPNTSPFLRPADIDEVAIGEEEDDELEGFTPTGYNHIRTFQFPNSSTEESPLLQSSSTSTRKLSMSSIASGSRFSANSTGPQTVFNSINTLLGIAMLTLPFGFKLTGWILGSILLIVSSALTDATAKYLGRILRKHPELNTYGDIAHLYGGQSVAILVTCMFTLDLIMASLSLTLLFTDSFALLLPNIPHTYFKACIISIAFVLSLLPLSILSLLSLVGILCTVAIIVIIIICGVLVDSSPGSLIMPAATNLWPSKAEHVLLSLGIFMAPWGGHPVFPELYRDMRHPKKFSHCCNVSFAITFLFDYFIGIIGFLMYGLSCEDSIIKNLMSNPNYPSWVNPLICTFMGLVPVSKLPLLTKPIVTVYEQLLGLNTHRRLSKSGSGSSFHKQEDPYYYTRIVCRFFYCGFLFTVSLLFNSFGKLVSFVGAAICFTLCLVLPFLFYLHFFKDELSRVHKAALVAGIAFGIAGSVLGTYASITMDVNI